MSTTGIWDPLAGISDKTKKADLLERLRRASKELRGYQKGEETKLKAIEERVKKKKGPTTDTRQVIAAADLDEWKETVEWLDQWEDYLPALLARLRRGGRELLNNE